MLFFIRALYLDATAAERNPERGTCWRWGKLWWLVVVEGFLFCYVFVILGLVDEGAAKPYANIRMHGGSNHILGVPIGLLQSEVIRVESTNSSY